MLFDTFVNEITVRGVLETVDPLHIGSSGKNSLDPTDVDDSVLKDSRGLPVIPGSSVKGMLRSRFESVIKAVGGRACSLDKKLMKECCVDNEKGSLIRKEYQNDLKACAEEIYRQSCDACRLFGGAEIAGRIQIKDCYYLGDRIVYEHRDGVKLDRKTGAAAGGAKFDYEIVPKGARFDFYLKAENLDGDQIKYLRFIIRELESGELSVGGKTTRGMGRIKLTVAPKCRDENGDLKITDVKALKEKLGL